MIEAGNVALTASGLEGVEYNCEFLQVAKARRAPAWLVNAICQEPGNLFPDVLSVTQMDSTQLELGRRSRPIRMGASGNGGRYFLRGCRRRSSAAQNHPCQHNPSLVP